MQIALRWFLPLALFAVLAVFLGWGLTLKPRDIPSALIDKPLPALELPAVEGLGLPGFATRDLAAGRPVLINVFASWCAPCRVEHPALKQLADKYGVAIYGIAYKDQPANIRRYLETLGNPYQAVGADPMGRAGIELGVYGVPETFIIGPDGRIAYKHISVISDADLKEKLLPLLEHLGARP